MSDQAYLTGSGLLREAINALVGEAINRRLPHPVGEAEMEAALATP